MQLTFVHNPLKENPTIGRIKKTTKVEIQSALGPQNHEKWRFWTPNIWVITLKMKVVGSHGVCWPTFWLNFWNVAPNEDHMGRRPYGCPIGSPGSPIESPGSLEGNAMTREHLHLRYGGGNCRGTSKELGKLISKFSNDTVNNLDYIYLNYSQLIMYIHIKLL